jgi:polyisoprenoid-binding protein YceI
MRILSGFTLLLAASLAQAADYKIDNTHSFVQFRTPHLGYSWLYGRFDVVGGEFVYDSDNPAKNRIHVTVNTASLDSNHQERDEHLHEKYLKTAAQPQAAFTSSAYEGDANGGSMTGELLLNGVKKQVVIPVKKMGEGADPWGGYRVGFEGALTIDTRDYGYTYQLGEHSYAVELQLGIEGVRQNSATHKKN